MSGPQGRSIRSRRPIDAELRVGHVHLRPADIDRVRDFCVGTLGFSSRERLAQTVKRLLDAGWPLRRLTDHDTHLGVYLSDPDGNDLELAWDRPFDERPRYGDEDATAIDAPLNLDELLAFAPGS